MSTAASTAATNEGGCKRFFKSNTTRNLISIIGMCTAGAILFTSIFALIGSGIDIKGIITAIYQCIFGLMLCIAEFRFKFGIRWCRFLAPFIGLGAFYIFVAVFAIGNGKWWQILVAAVTGALGVINCIYGFCGMTRIEMDDPRQEQLERDMAVKYAVAKGQENNTPENRAAAATAAKSAAAHLEEGNHKGANANPFENDNPFESSSNFGKSAYN